MFLICILVVFISQSIIASEIQEEVEVLDLASMLIENNNLTRAEATLRGVKDPNDVETDRFYLLKGILAQKQSRILESIKLLELAEKNKIEEKYKSLFFETMAKSLVLNKQFNEALKLLDKNKQFLIKRSLLSS